MLFRSNPITAFLIRRMAKIRFASILNLLADRAILPELLQEDCNPVALAAALTPLLTDPNAGVDQRTDTRTYLDMLRPAAGLPSEAAAEAVLALLR